MDDVARLRREMFAFEAAARRAAELAAAPAVPSCPGWSVADLVLHLGTVHRMVAGIVGERLVSPPAPADVPLPVQDGWPDPGSAPNLGPLPASLLDWFAGGAATLTKVFAAADPGERV